MSNSAPAPFRIGEDVVIALDLVEGDPAAIGTITAGMRRMIRAGGSGLLQPDPSQTPITAIVSPRVASGGFPAGWNLTVPASVTETLEPGMYGIDAKLDATTGSIDITETTALISLTVAAI